MKDLFTVNLNKRELNLHSKKYENVVRVHHQNTLEHEQAKLKVCYYLQSQDRSYMTECKFVKGGRADIVDLSRGVIYEILHTEKESNIEKKKLKYPFPIVNLTTKTILTTDLEDFEDIL